MITCSVVACREPFVVPNPDEIRRALHVVLNPANHPVLIHNLRGDSAASVVVGILRRVQRWSLAAIFEEYRRFATSGAALDLQVIETFDLSSLQHVEHEFMVYEPHDSSRRPRPRRRSRPIRAQRRAARAARRVLVARGQRSR